MAWCEGKASFRRLPAGVIVLRRISEGAQDAIKRTPHSTVIPLSELPPRSFDVAVVSAGISCALMANGLTAMGESVLIVDAQKGARTRLAKCRQRVRWQLNVRAVSAL